MMNNIPPEVFIAVGTIAAAMISGTIAFLNLIISKEQTVSEFRQKWIEALREDLADFLSASISISVHRQLLEKKTDSSGKISLVNTDPVIPEINRAYSTYHRIVLRLNPKEHKKLTKYINDLEKALSNPKVIAVPSKCNEIIGLVNSESQIILKREWLRVKRGEIAYRAVKIVSAVVLLSAVLAALMGIGIIPIGA